MRLQIGPGDVWRRAFAALAVTDGRDVLYYFFKLNFQSRA